MKNLFKKGAIVAGLLAIGAALGFAKSKEGKGVKADVQQDIAELTKHLKRDLRQVKNATQENYDALVTAAVEEYSKTKEMAQETKDALVADLRNKWHELEKEYLA